MRLRSFLPLALLAVRLLAKDVIDAVRDGTYRSYTLAADGKATTRPNYSSLDDSFLPYGQVTSYGYSQRTYGPPPPPPPTTQLHGAELRDALARVHGRLLAPSANRSLPAMLADDRHLGPSAVACVEADGDGGVAEEDYAEWCRQTANRLYGEGEFGQAVAWYGHALSALGASSTAAPP